MPARAAAPRPAARRRTFASPLPKRPVHRRATAARKSHVTPKKVRTAAVHRRPAVRRHTVAALPKRPIGYRARPAVRRVTFASPICEDRAPMISSMLGLPNAPFLGAPLSETALQDVIAPTSVLPGAVPVAGYSEGPGAIGGGTSTATPGAPVAPGFGTPGFSTPGVSVPSFSSPGFSVPVAGVPVPSDLLTPPGNPGLVTPPNLISSVPEPATWAISFLGFGFVGGAMRRRRPLPAAA